MNTSFQIIGYDENDNPCVLPSPFWLTLNCDIDAPADSLTLVFVNEEIPEIQRIEITGDIDFFGVVDTISHQSDKNGEKTTLYCRSIAAMLLDTQATPGKTVSPSLNVMTVISSCGGLLNGFKYNTYKSVPYLNVGAGSSMWNLVNTFCLQTMGYPARITKDRYITAKPFSSQVVHNIENVISKEDVTDFSEVITSVAIKNKEGAYSTVVPNPYVTLSTSRHRFITPGVGWQNAPTTYANVVMKNSMVHYKTKTLTLSGFHPAQIGDNAVFQNITYAVIGVCHKLDSSGATTKLTLTDKKYL